MAAIETPVSYEKLLASVKGLNEIALSYAEKLTELNLSILRKQSDAVLAVWREALAVEDREGLKKYVARQAEAARGLAEGYAADAKTAAEIGMEAAEGVRKLAEGSVAVVAKKAA